MASYVNSGEFTPIYLVADHYIGYLRILVPLTGMTAVFAAFTAISIAVEPHALRARRARGSRRARSRSPTRTRRRGTRRSSCSAAASCCPILIGLYQDRNPLLAFGWIGEAYVFFVLIPYTLTCVANIFYHLRVERGSFNVLWNLVLPVLGIAINCYIFYKNFLKTFLFDATSFKYQTSITTACFALVLAAVVFTLVGIRKTGTAKTPHHFSEIAEGTHD